MIPDGGRLLAAPQEAHLGGGGFKASEEMLLLGHMSDVTNRPLVCVTLAFAIGIGIAAACAWPGLLMILATAAIAMVVWFLRRRPGWAAAVALAAAAGAGGLVYLLSAVRPGADVSHLPQGGQTLVGTVAGAPRYADGLWSFVLEAESHEQGPRSEPVVGRVYVRLKSPQQVERGQCWRLTGKLRAPREARNPGARSEAARLASLEVTAVLTVGAEELAEVLGQGQLRPVAAHAFAAQRRALEILERYVSGPYRELTAAVAASVIFGVHAAPPPAEITEVFRRAGTIHLLVVSGAMVSMLFALVFLPGTLGAGWRRLGEERRAGTASRGRGKITFRPGLWAAALAVLVVTYYAILTEGGQAVMRAAIMGAFVGLALALRRVPAVAREHGLNVDHYTLLAAAALGILTVSPGALFQPGFQLSFAAVWAIIYLIPKAVPLTAWLPRWLGLTVVGTIGAQLATFPILAWHYRQAPIAGFGANLFAIPLAGIVLVAGMLTCALGVTAPWLAPVAGWVTGGATRWMVWVSSAFGSLPGASPEVARPGFLAIIVWYAGMVGVGWWMEKRGERRP